MEFALVKNVSRELSNKTLIIQNFSDELENEFKRNKYGESLNSIIIGVICVSPQFETFFKPRKPKYTKRKRNINSEGFNYQIENCLEFDIKLDFETIKNSTDQEIKLHIAKEILQSLNILEEIKVKIKDFNTEKFKKDLNLHFKEKYFN